MKRSLRADRMIVVSVNWFYVIVLRDISLVALAKTCNGHSLEFSTGIPLGILSTFALMSPKDSSQSM